MEVRSCHTFVQSLQEIKISEQRQSLHPALNLISEMSPFRLSCKHTGLFVLDQTCQAHRCLGGLGPFCSHNPECSSTSFRSLLNSHLRRQGSPALTCPPSSFSIPPLGVILIFGTEFHLTYCTFISLVLCLHRKNVCPMKAGSLAGLFTVIRPATVNTRGPLRTFVAE